MRKLESKQTEAMCGGVDRATYCGTLKAMFPGNGGGYQGDIGLFMSTFESNCGNYGYALWEEQAP